MQADIRDIDYSEFAGSVQFVTGGPPCQPFSLGGRHRGREDTRDMFPEAVRAVRELRPQGFLFENVRGLLRGSFASYFSYIILQLTHPEVSALTGENWKDHLRRLELSHFSFEETGLKYNVVFRQVNAADYGVPQMRHRVVIVGFRSDVETDFCFPAPAYSRGDLLRAKRNGAYWKDHGMSSPPLPENSPRPNGLMGIARWRTVRDALAGLPDPRSGVCGGFANHEFRNGARAYRGHSGSVLDEPSKALKAGVHGVPGGENSLSLDNGALRYYTAREGARIQTFPDEYVFSGSWTENMRQIGNAVPVLLARTIGESVTKSLKNAGVCHG
jgi:DNA (cytosine-5)-methyltransferase 1